MSLKPSGIKDNSRRKGVPAQKLEMRRKEAQERQKAYDKLTTEQKLAKLDSGGFTASRQREKLVVQLQSK